MLQQTRGARKPLSNLGNPEGRATRPFEAALRCVP
jgi:hypothetical protein